MASLLTTAPKFPVVWHLKNWASEIRFGSWHHMSRCLTSKWFGKTPWKAQWPRTFVHQTVTKGETKIIKHCIHPPPSLGRKTSFGLGRQQLAGPRVKATVSDSQGPPAVRLCCFYTQLRTPNMPLEWCRSNPRQLLIRNDRNETLGNTDPKSNEFHYKICILMYTFQGAWVSMDHC